MTSRCSLDGPRLCFGTAASERFIVLDRITRCHNPEVATHLIEAKVLEMLRNTVFVPEKLLACIQGLEGGRNDKHENLVQRVERCTARIAGVEAQKQCTIDLYAAGGLSKDVYIADNLTLDGELQQSTTW
jgi:hypothetical protein